MHSSCPLPTSFDVPSLTEQSTLPDQNSPRNRSRTRVEQRDAHLDAFEHSGLNAAAYARLHRLNYQTFMVWRKKRRAQLVGQPSPQASFAEVVFDDEPNSSVKDGLKISLPGAVVLEIHSMAMLPLAIHLIQALRKS